LPSRLALRLDRRLFAWGFLGSKARRNCTSDSLSFC
jgi:hypothetical protein